MKGHSAPTSPILHLARLNTLRVIVDFFFYSYTPGDVVMIQPCNSSESVDAFLQLLGLNPDQEFSLQPNDPGRFTCVCLFHVVLSFVDL